MFLCYVLKMLLSDSSFKGDVVLELQAEHERVLFPADGSTPQTGGLSAFWSYLNVQDNWYLCDSGSKRAGEPTVVDA
jgi:hypothetical protein